MARQDQANDQFSLTSFLYGGNADYIEQLYAAYEDDPASVDPEWQDFFAGAEGRRRRRAQERQGRLLGKAQLAAAGQWRAGLGARRQLGPRREASSKRRSRPRRSANGAVLSDADVHPGDARFRARHHDDPRLPHARPPARQARSARHRQAARGLQRAVAGQLTASPRPTTTARSSSTTCSGSNSRTIRQMLEILTRTYCSTLGVEFMHISDPEEKAWIQERIEGAGQGASPSPPKARRRSCRS